MQSRKELYQDVVQDGYSKEIYRMLRTKHKKLQEIENIEKELSKGANISDERREKLKAKESLQQSVNELTAVLELYKKNNVKENIDTNT